MSVLQLTLGGALADSPVIDKPMSVSRRFRVIRRDGETAIELAGEKGEEKQDTIKDLATSLSADRYQQLRYLVSLKKELQEFALRVDSLLGQVIFRAGCENFTSASNMEDVLEFITSHPHYKHRQYFRNHPKMAEKDLESIVYRLLFMYALFQ